MTRYTYKVIPAPAKGRKASGVKGAEARFAHGLEEAINELAAQGWEYLRADILPSEERQGLTSTATVYRSVLVFRRATHEMEAAEPRLAIRRTAPPLTARPPETAPEEDAEGGAETEQPEQRRAAQHGDDRDPAEDTPDAGEDRGDIPRT